YVLELWADRGALAFVARLQGPSPSKEQESRERHRYEEEDPHDEGSAGIEGEEQGRHCQQKQMRSEAIEAPKPHVASKNGAIQNAFFGCASPTLVLQGMGCLPLSHRVGAKAPGHERSQLTAGGKVLGGFPLDRFEARIRFGSFLF